MVKRIEIPSYSLNGKRLISRVQYNEVGGFVEGVMVVDDIETRLTYTEYTTHDSLDQVLEYIM